MPTNAPEKVGSVFRVPLSQLHPHPQNPFTVRDDSAMQELKESVSQNGVLVPAIARPRAEGGYELIAGHRRKYACEQAGQDSMPVIVLNLNDDEAVIQLVDSNIQREDILPSERAKACGKPIYSKSHRVKYCPDCSLRERRRWDAQRKRVQYWNLRI